MAKRKPARPVARARRATGAGDRTVDVRRYAALAVVALSALAIFPVFSDNYNLAKFGFVAAFLAIVTVATATRLVGRNRTSRPTGPVAWSLAAFVIAVCVATIVAPSRGEAIIGTYGRYDGLVTTLACVALLLVVARSFTDDWLARLRVAIIGTAAVVGLVALIEALARHAFGSHIIVRSTVGNVDFLGAYLGIAAPVALSLAVDKAREPWLRIAAGITTLICVAGSVASGAQEGVVAAGIGIAIVAALNMANDNPHRLRLLGGVTAIGVVAAALVVVGLYAHGPFGFLGHESTVINRRLYWQTAGRMVRAHPVVGVGLGSFGDHYFQYWPVHATHRIGSNRFADAASNVPLTMLAEGGVLLAGTYLAVVVTVAARVLRRLRDEPSQSPMLIGFVAGWVAYLAQSLVSIDKISLIVLGWVLAGAILAATAQPFAEVALRAAASDQPVQRSSTRARVALGIGTIAAIIGLVPALNLFRADADLKAGLHATSASAAAAHEVAAARHAGWLPTYPDQAGQALLAVHQPEAALAEFDRAVGGDPLDRTGRLSTGAADVTLGRYAAAAAAFRELARHDHHDPVRLEELAQLAIRQGNTTRATHLLNRANRLHHDKAIHQLRGLLPQTPAP